eukprot:GSA120T00023513001.1
MVSAISEKDLVQEIQTAAFPCAVKTKQALIANEKFYQEPNVPAPILGRVIAVRLLEDSVPAAPGTTISQVSKPWPPYLRKVSSFNASNCEQVDVSLGAPVSPVKDSEPGVLEYASVSKQAANIANSQQTANAKQAAIAAKANAAAQSNVAKAKAAAAAKSASGQIVMLQTEKTEMKMFSQSNKALLQEHQSSKNEHMLLANRMQQMSRVVYQAEAKNISYQTVPVVKAELCDRLSSTDVFSKDLNATGGCNQFYLQQFSSESFENGSLKQSWHSRAFLDMEVRNAKMFNCEAIDQ